MASTLLDTSQSDNNAPRFTTSFTTHYANEREGNDHLDGVADAKQAKMDGGASPQETGQVRLLASAAQTQKPPQDGNATGGAEDTTPKASQQSGTPGGTEGGATSSYYEDMKDRMPSMNKRFFDARRGNQLS